MKSQDLGNMPKILWEHPNPERTQIYKFKKMIERKRGVNLPVWQLYTAQARILPSCWPYNPCNGNMRSLLTGPMPFIDLP